MYQRSARIYDAIYGAKDYSGEAARIHALIREHVPGAAALLDVACGTGRHLEHLAAHYRGEGLDRQPELLEIARERNPDVPLHLGDMIEFDLGRRFDAVICLFSSIGYVRTVDNLHRAIAAMSRQLVSPGVLIVEPWITPDAWKPEGVHASFVDEPGLKIARINVSETEGSLSVMDMHHLVGTPEGVEYFVERHEMGLFTPEEYASAFEAAELEVLHDPEGLTGRGLFLGIRRPESG